MSNSTLSIPVTRISACLMLNYQTETTVFKLCMLYFQRISSDYLEITTAVFVLCGSPKQSPDIALLFSGPVRLSMSLGTELRHT